MEELLKIAKENYPAGTVFKSAFDPQNTQIVEGNWENVSNGIIVSPGATYIYYKENWAEIISKPEVKEETYKFPELQSGGGIIPGREVFKESKKDPINPSHYAGKIECIDAIESALSPEEFKGFLRGNVIKYNWRCMQKNGVEDLKKAIWYEERLIKTLENVESKSN